jgi:hypothetical protein
MQASELIVEHPCAIRTARIVCVADGFQLRARFPGQRGEWTLTSPGGIADTFLPPGLEAFARVGCGWTSRFPSTSPERPYPMPFKTLLSLTLAAATGLASAQGMPLHCATPTLRHRPTGRKRPHHQGGHRMP